MSQQQLSDAHAHLRRGRLTPGEQIRSAANDNDLDSMTSLIQQFKSSPATINDADSFGNTALHVAASHGFMPIVKLLVENGANINAQDKYGQTALIYAAFSGMVKIVELLAAKKADLNKQTKFGQTALMKAAFSGSIPTVVRLIDNKADVNVSNNDGRTALMFAAEHSYLTICQVLVEHGNADVDATDKNGMSAIMFGAEKGCWLVVEYLAKIGANLALKTKDGKTVHEMVDITASDQSQHRARICIAIKEGLAKKDAYAQARGHNSVHDILKSIESPTSAAHS